MSRVFSASGNGRRAIVSPAVPMTVDSVNAPARRPAAVPTSYRSNFAKMTVTTRLVTQSTTVNATCVRAFRLSPRKNCGPTL